MCNGVYGATASTISQFWSLKTVTIVSHEVQDNFDLNTVLGNVFQEMMMQYLFKEFVFAKPKTKKHIIL